MKIKEMFFSVLLSIVMGLGFSMCQTPILMEARSSTEGDFWSDDLTLEVQKGSSDEKVDVKIIPKEKEQVIEGFGGCFNELGWEALAHLTNDERERIMRDLFDPENGCGFNLCRMPIGASDYAIDWYSLNEHAGDLGMIYFSIERDQLRLIPFIHAAQKYAPDLKLWASPWSPPIWMKTNNHYACRQAKVNDLKPEQTGREMETQFKMEHDILEAYALYFSRPVARCKSNSNIGNSHGKWKRS